MEIDGGRIHFIDTPGFDDTDLKDVDILEIIALYLTNKQSLKIQVSGILYLHRITDDRLGGCAIKNLSLFRGLVGSRNMENVIFVTTMWGELSNKQRGDERLNELTKTNKFWGRMLELGATVDKHDGSRQDGARIINNLLQKTPCTLQIQAEMERGIKLNDTTAGKEVNDRIAVLQAKYERDIKNLKQEVQEARDANDILEMKERLRDQAEVMEKIEQARQAQERLFEAAIQQQQEQITFLQSKGEQKCVIL